MPIMSSTLMSGSGVGVADLAAGVAEGAGGAAVATSRRSNAMIGGSGAEVSIFSASGRGSPGPAPAVMRLTSNVMF